MGVRNGVPYSEDPVVNHRITAPMSVDGSIDEDYMDRENVQRIMSIFDSEDWDEGFPIAD